MSGNGTGLGQRPERMLDVLTPESCGGCGLITDKWIKENPDQKWIRIDIHPGIALFCCPKCNMAMFNPNLQANNARMVKWQKEDNEQRIRVASSIIDPKTNKIVDLGRV
jgi:hypothetical protein